MQNPVSEFERAFAEMAGVDYAIAVNSGTSALHASIVAAIRPGDEVIMPALCPAMDAFAIIHAGGVPVFADVDEHSHLVTAETVREKITEKTSAIITVALHGLPVDMDPIMDDISGIVFIEDCAQCLFGKYNDNCAGTADIGCFSFEKKKHLTTGSEGGMVVTNSPLYAQAIRKFAGLGYKHMTSEAGRTSLSASEYQRPDYERFDTIGLNYRMSEMQAVVGTGLLRHASDAIDRRRSIAAMWLAATAGCSWLKPQTWLHNARHTYYSVAFEFTREDWIGFYNEFLLRGGDGFYAMPKVPYQEPALKHLTASCPVAERLQKRLMLFKTHYRNIDEARRQTDILAKLIDEVGR